MTSSRSIFSITFAAKCLAVGHTRYGVLWTRRISLEISLIRLFTVLMRPRCPFYMSSNPVITCRKSFLWSLYLSSKVTSLRQFSVSLLSSPRFTCLRLPSFKACLFQEDAEQHWLSQVMAGLMRTQKAYHIDCVWWRKKGLRLSQFIVTLQELCGIGWIMDNWMKWTVRERVENARGCPPFFGTVPL